MKFLPILFVVALIALGCSTETPEQEAQQLTMTELTQTPGYAWFPAEMSTYTPDVAMVAEIKKRFSTTEHKICIFVKPTCACRGTQRLFPRIMKALQEAQVDMSRVEIWSMRATGDKHKYEQKMSITALPTIFVMRKDEVRTQIKDADYNDTNADSLIAEALLR